jgi:hypothetical protein
VELDLTQFHPSLAQAPFDVNDPNVIAAAGPCTIYPKPTFIMGSHQFTAIEQNPDVPSRWVNLARGSHKVVQFKDAAANRFVAVAVEVIEYKPAKRHGQSATDPN